MNNKKNNTNKKKYSINSYKKSNLLIGAKYKSTITENKIQAIALSSIQKAVENADGNLECTFTAAELRKYFGDNSGSLYKRLDSTAHKMAGSVIGFTDEESQSFVYMPVIAKAEYKNSKFTITFNGELKNQILNLQEKYTVLNLDTMMKFDHVYSFRLYEFLKSEYFKKKYMKQGRLIGMGYEMSIPIAEMRLLMGTIDANEDKVRAILSKGKIPDYDKAVEVATKSKFKEWKEFKRSVIDVAVNEINAKTELHVDSKTERAGIGGKAVGIMFIITDKEDVEEESSVDVVDENEIDIFNLIDQVRAFVKEEISTADIKSIIECADYNIDIVKEKYDIARKQKINNLTGWMIKAIKDDYQPGVSTKNERNSYNNFQQNSYDYEELENSLLKN